MESLVGYGSDDDVETERSHQHTSVGPSSRRREDDTNYDDVNMDLSEESQSVESEPELPPAESAPRPSRDDRRGSNDSRDKERTRDTGRDRTRDGPRDRERHRDGQRDGERDGPRDRRRDGDRHERDRRSPKRDDRHNKGDRSRGSQDSRRGLLGDRPEDKSETKMPALMDLKPYDGEPPPSARGHDARDAVSPRFTERGRRDRERERERDRDRHPRRSEERRGGRGADRTDRSRSRGAAFPPPQATCSNDRDRRGSPPSGDYRPSSYKVNRKLEVMEKMGLQIKTPDGSMATAQQLRAAASEAPSGLPPYYNPSAVTSNKALDQKRKLLWSHKEKSESGAACWSGARFSQDADGRQVSKFMRLMGIKDPAATATKPEAPEADPNKKQEELFQAMQAQYEVARATTHTMRGVGLGFQRGNF